MEETDEILERHPFEADETNILNNPLVKTTEAFLKKHFNQLPYQSLESDASIKGGKSDPNAYENILMISLSGGKCLRFNFLVDYNIILFIYLIRRC